MSDVSGVVWKSLGIPRRRIAGGTLTSVSTLVHRFAERLATGSVSPRPWGSLEITAPVRYGWRGYRLTVNPPGTSTAERRQLWLDRTIPYLTAALAIPAVLMFQPGSPPIAVLLVIPIGMAVIAGIRGRTKKLRSRVRRLNASYVELGGATRVIGDGALLSTSVEALREMDRARRADEISPAEYERRWAVVYDSLSPEGVGSEGVGPEGGFPHRGADSAGSPERGTPQA